MDQTQLTEWYLGKEARKAHEHITERMAELRERENPYVGWNPEKKREELAEVLEADSDE